MVCSFQTIVSALNLTECCVYRSQQDSPDGDLITFSLKLAERSTRNNRGGPLFLPAIPF